MVKKSRGIEKQSIKQKNIMAYNDTDEQHQEYTKNTEQKLVTN